MDQELEQMAARAAKMEELREVKTVMRNFGTEINGIMQDQQSLARWLALGGTDETFGKIDRRHFASMTAEQQAAYARGYGVMNG